MRNACFFFAGLALGMIPVDMLTHRGSGIFFDVVPPIILLVLAFTIFKPKEGSHA